MKTRESNTAFCHFVLHNCVFCCWILGARLELLQRIKELLNDKTYLEILLKHSLLGPTLRVSDSEDLG